MNPLSYFRGKKVTVMGLGLLGGVGDIAFLAESGADIIATDLKSEEELRPSLEKLKLFPNIRYTLGRHELADFQGRDLIIKAPSTPLDSPYIAEARKEGTEVSMWAALFARFARDEGATLIGVTGTRGKTTVTAMVSAILRAAGTPVVEGGNVQGTSVLPQLAQVTSGTVAVLELDSWKLQGFGSPSTKSDLVLGKAPLSPDIAVFTTFYDDHLNYYAGDRDAYLADKANIFLYQSEEDTLILGKQCAPTLIEKYGERIAANVIVADEAKLPEAWLLRIPGIHNRYNAALALTAARAYGVTDEVSRTALEAFAGVPGRLELIAEKNGVKIYNDTTSTTPESTIAALGALSNFRHRMSEIVLIMGGTDKDLPLEKLAEKLREVKGLVLLAGTGTQRLVNSLQSTANSNFSGSYTELSPAVQKAFELAESGDTILFSPAFTSFGMFKNEYDRGDQFNAIVKELV